MTSILNIHLFRALVYCKSCHDGVTNPDLVKMCECRKKSELGSKFLEDYYFTVATVDL